MSARLIAARSCASVTDEEYLSCHTQAFKAVSSLGVSPLLVTISSLPAGVTSAIAAFAPLGTGVMQPISFNTTFVVPGHNMNTVYIIDQYPHPTAYYAILCVNHLETGIIDQYDHYGMGMRANIPAQIIGTETTQTLGFDATEPYAAYAGFSKASSDFLGWLNAGPGFPVPPT